MGKWSRALGYAWLAVLGLALLVSAAGAYVRAMRVEEYARSCDAFGYLRMAQEVRAAAAQGRYPDYHLDAPHTRLLIDYLRSRDVPSADWDELVAPHAHHYFARTGHVGVQYPPGTGLLLALFPQDNCSHRLDETVIGFFLAVGLGVLIVAGRNRAWLAAGGAVVALQLGLDILARMSDFSYSINAMLAPLLLALVALFVVRSVAHKPRLAWAVAFLSGACFGFAILVRLPIVLLLPGVAVLLVGPTWRTWINGGVVAFAAGLGLCGLLPLLIHQQHLAGAWYLPTYSRTDDTPPTFSVLATNFLYYLGNGYGSQYRDLLLTSFVGLVGLALWRGRASDTGSPLSWSRLIVAALVLWWVPTLFFLTHRVTVPYYQFPSMFAAAVLLGLGGLAISCCNRADKPATFTWRRRLGLAAALVPCFLAPGLAWQNRPDTFATPEVGAHHTHFPAELTDERAWVFADTLSGTLWYEERRAAYKADETFAGSRTRAVVYRFIFERGEPFYVIRDCPEMQPVLDEIEQLGGTLESRGEVDGYPYYLIHWPEAGPNGADSPKAG